MRRALLIAAGLLLAIAAAGCGGSPPVTVVSVDPTNLDGRALYAAACARCHGSELQGTTEGPPFLNAIYRPGHHGDASFLLAVRRGVQPHHWSFGPMLPVEGLSDPQVAAIVAFVRAQQQAAGIR